MSHMNHNLQPQVKQHIIEIMIKPHPDGFRSIVITRDTICGEIVGEMNTTPDNEIPCSIYISGNRPQITYLRHKSNFPGIPIILQI